MNAVSLHFYALGEGGGAPTARLTASRKLLTPSVADVVHQHLVCLNSVCRHFVPLPFLLRPIINRFGGRYVN